MSWAVGFDSRWQRDIGYGVPAYCDHPDCDAEINRGLGYVCCGSEPYGGEHGCGRYFCQAHEAVTWIDQHGNELAHARCGHTERDHVSGDHLDWIRHKLTDETWQAWRDENALEASRLRFVLGYCERSRLTWHFLSRHRVVLECDCGEEGCEGWAMIPHDLVDVHLAFCHPNPDVRAAARERDRQALARDD